MDLKMLAATWVGAATTILASLTRLNQAVTLAVGLATFAATIVWIICQIRKELRETRKTRE